MLCVSGLGLSGLASPAMAGIRTGIDVSVSGKVSTNPFNASNPGAAVVAISPSVGPWLTYEDTNTTIELRGDVLVDQYTRVYGTNTNGSVHLGLEQLLSSSFTLNAAADYFDSNAGLHDFLLARATAPDTPIPPGTPLPDVSTAGLRTRTQTMSGRVGGDLKISALDTLTFNFSGALTRSDASITSDFVTETAYFSYNRQFSPRTVGLLSVQGSNVDYLNTTEGDGTIVSPQLGIRQQFSQRIHLELSLGATFANFTRGNDRQEKFTVLAGSIRLCNTIQHGEICLNGARTAQPTALGGIAASSDVSLGLDHTIGRSNTLSVTARYSRVEQSNELFGFQQDFAGLMLSFTRKFSNRFSAFINPSYSKTFDNVAPRDGNFEVRAGVRFRFGAIR